MNFLTPEELDEAVAQEAERVERERNKCRILALLETVPADSPLWDQLIVGLVAEALLDLRGRLEDEQSFGSVGNKVPFFGQDNGE